LYGSTACVGRKEGDVEHGPQDVSNFGLLTQVWQVGTCKLDMEGTSTWDVQAGDDWGCCCGASASKLEVPKMLEPTKAAPTTPARP